MSSRTLFAVLCLAALASLPACSRKPPPTTVTSISGASGFEGAERYVEVVNTGPPLTDVEARITVWFDDNTSTELWHHYDVWDRQEKKHYLLGPWPMDTIHRYRLEGTARQYGQEVSCQAEFHATPILFAAETNGDPPVVTVFYRGKTLLSNVQVTFTVFRTDGTSEVLVRRLNVWNPDDAQSLQVKAGPRIQKVTIEGNADVDGKTTPISFSVHW